MCSNYRPVTSNDRLLTFFGVERAGEERETDVFPLGLAPFIRLIRPGQGSSPGRPALVAEDGQFGLLPHFATEVQYGRRTYNARSETVHQLASFRQAWAAGQRCVIPAEAIYEPNWETGRGVRWRIGLPGARPMGIAGLYRRWRHPQGGEMFTFAMLTVNADGHPVMRRFHKPGEEKRMVVILPEADYLGWLGGSVADAARYFQAWGGELVIAAAPLARATAVSREPPPQDELF